MSHIVSSQPKVYTTILQHAALYGSLWLLSPYDSLWHEFQVKAFSNNPSVGLLRRMSVEADHPVDVPEAETLALSDSLWFRETFHQTKFHRYRFQLDGAEQVLTDTETAWVLPYEMTEYTDGLALRDGFTMRCSDRLYRRLVPSEI